MEPVVLRVYGQPAPQGSKSAYIRGGRAVVTEGTSKKAKDSHVAWRQAVATAARDWQEAQGGAPLLDGPLSLTLCFLIDKPKSKPKKAEWADVQPDIDKLLRCVLDACTGVVVKDDARVVQVVMEKPYADVDEGPGCWLVLEPVRRHLITRAMRRQAVDATEVAS